MRRAFFAVLLLAAAPALAQEGEAPIEIQDAYAIQAVPGAPTAAAFMVIRNHGTAPDRLVSAASPVSERVELHTHEEKDGVMRMVEVEEGFEIAADAEIRLERGGAHVMFLGVTGPFEDGATVPLTLTFEQAGEVTVEVPVDLGRLAEDVEGMDHGHMDHDGEGG